MLDFYALPISNFCAKVEIALQLKNLSYRTCAPPGGYGSERYRQIVPTGTIPALIDGTLILSESDAILEYLNEAFPEPDLLNGDAKTRAAQRQLCRLHDTRFEPTLRAMFGAMDPNHRNSTQLSLQLVEFRRKLAELSSLCSPNPYLGGTSPGMADCALAPTIWLARRMFAVLGDDVGLSRELEDWFERISAHKSVNLVLRRHDAAITKWLLAKGNKTPANWP